METQHLRRSLARLAGIPLKASLVLSFTLLGFACMGYHPGLEDDGIYLSAVKADLNPALYPHDSDFFRLQLQASIFARWIAATVRATGMSVAAAELFWQFLSLFATLWAAHSIARKLFPEARTQWAGVALLAAMFTLPVSGAALNIADQHLHPRNMAGALILIAIERILSRRSWQALALLALALVVHPIMAAFGISFSIILACASPVAQRVQLPTHSASMAAAAPLSWMFEPASPVWRKAVQTRRYYFLYQWTWYEWLGALGPLVLFWLLWRFARRQGRTHLAHFALALLIYGVFQQAVAMIMLGPSALIRLTPLQPMRYLQLVYVFLVLMAGCLLGEYVLRRSILRWSVFVLVSFGSMFVSQRLMYPDTPQLELPGLAPGNPWTQAFEWIRRNTPSDAYFALDPNYLAAPGEDYHSFRALAERSQLADAIKDTAVVTQGPALGPAGEKLAAAQAGWPRFKLADFERLRAEFGVDWVLVGYPAPAGLGCVWHNDRLAICRIPAPASAPAIQSAANPLYFDYLEVPGPSYDN